MALSDTKRVAYPTTGADGPPGRVVRVRGGSGSFAADTPFFVRHGWIFSDSEADYDEVRADPNTGFVLILNDEDEFPSTQITSTFQTETARYDTIDFPDGLPAGEQVFEGLWIRLGEVVQTAIVTIDFQG